MPNFTIFSKILITVFYLLSFSFYSAAANLQTIPIEQATLQKSLNTVGVFSYENTALNIDVLNPQLALLANNQAGVKAQVKATIFGSMQTDLFISTRGNLRYNAEQGAFYLDNIQLESLSSEKLSNWQLIGIKASLPSLLNQLFQWQPIYRLDENKKEEKLAKKALKDVKIDQQKLLVTIDIEQLSQQQLASLLQLKL